MPTGFTNTSCTNANNADIQTIKYLINKYLHIWKLRTILDIKYFILSICNFFPHCHCPSEIATVTLSDEEVWKNATWSYPWEKYRWCWMYSTTFNPVKPELIPICYLLALLAHHFIHVSRIRVKSLTIRLLMSYIYGAPILDVSRSHTTTQHSR